MKKPKAVPHLMYDWNDCVEYIETKYKIDIRNYQGKPEQDFWIWWITGGDSTSNGCKLAMEFDSKRPDLYAYTDEEGNKWPEEIVSLFAKEFGNEDGYLDIDFWVEW